MLAFNGLFFNYARYPPYTPKTLSATRLALGMPDIPAWQRIKKIILFGGTAFAIAAIAAWVKWRSGLV